MLTMTGLWGWMLDACLCQINVDRNKGITSITYNHLNLPETITFNHSDKIDYLYNAVGQKVQKTVTQYLTNSMEVKEVDYLDGYQYAGGVLQFFPHGEGYISATPNSIDINGVSSYFYNYVFNYTDHLGNVRISYTRDPGSNQLKILEENHYYPFGLKHSIYSTGHKRDYVSREDENSGASLPPVVDYVTSTRYQYKYNGKEWQDELGLNVYDMDMRQYDPAIARWVVLDPVIHHSMSPYNAFDNNPVFWADPSGADSIFDQLGTSYTGISIQGTGMEIGAGGAEGERKNEEGAKTAKDPGKPKTALGRFFSKIGKGIRSVFGGGKGRGYNYTITNDLTPKEEALFYSDTTTETNSVSFPQNLIVELSIETSKTQGNSKIINTDIETVVDANSVSNNQVKRNSQLNFGVVNGTIYVSNTEVGVSFLQSLGGMVGLSVNGSINFASPEHSSIGVRFHENVNLNNTSSSIGGGIKPVGILTVFATAIISRVSPPSLVPMPMPSPAAYVPPTQMSTTK